MPLVIALRSLVRMRYVLLGIFRGVYTQNHQSWQGKDMKKSSIMTFYALYDFFALVV